MCYCVFPAFNQSIYQSPINQCTRSYNIGLLYMCMYVCMYASSIMCIVDWSIVLASIMCTSWLEHSLMLEKDVLHSYNILLYSYNSHSCNFNFLCYNNIIITVFMEGGNATRYVFIMHAHAQSSLISVRVVFWHYIHKCMIVLLTCYRC